jgi:trk system potassium uptake protein TrkH
VDVTGSLSLVGTLILFVSPSVLFPAALAVGYGEPVWPFLAAGAIASTTGYGLSRLDAGVAALGSREGYLVVSLTWLCVALFGALPYLFSGNAQLDRPLDAFFESMSGFTTTGASVATDVEALPNSILMWRALTQWLGGMGIIVLVLAVLPRLRVGGRQLLESEVPGPEVDSLGERIRQTAQRLWLIYVAITALEVLLLTIFGLTGIDEQMDLFRAVAQSFTTLPSGGFSTEARSIEAFSAATQWVIAFFMVVAGTNFALTYRAFVRRDPGVFPRNEEFRLYIGLLALASFVLTIELWAEGIAEGELAVREGVFQTVSMMTTTGYATTDFNEWTILSQILLVGLFFIGGSAGSTSGSVKVIRHLLMGKSLRREVSQTLHPEIVQPIRYNGATVDERILRAISSFVLIYLGIFILGTIAIVLDTAIQGPDLSALDAIAATATALSNTGPGLGIAGPMGSFAPFSDISTAILSTMMWLGRLEVIPIIVLLTRSYWRV